MIPAARFIPVAEETGLIIPLGEWVLREACAQMKAWLEGGLMLDTMAVNLSPHQFGRPNIHETIGDILAEIGLPARFLELEITEGSLMESGSDVERKLNALKALGVRLAIDAEAMHAAAQVLVGLHDFTTFRDMACQSKSPLKTLDVARVFRVGDEVHLVFEARSFLHRQVRSMTGTLVEVGVGRWTAEDVRDALEAKDRTACGPVTASVCARAAIPNSSSACWRRRAPS